MFCYMYVFVRVWCFGGRETEGENPPTGNESKMKAWHSQCSRAVMDYQAHLGIGCNGSQAQVFTVLVPSLVPTYYLGVWYLGAKG